MNFKDHLNLKGEHALFNPSQSSWLRYSDDKIIEKYKAQYRTTLGTEFHEYAASQIELGIKQTSIKNLVNSIMTCIYGKYNKNVNYGLKLIENIRYIPRDVFETIKIYINDGIGYRMIPEQVLYYSEFIFGTADTICFNEKTSELRIHDLKTGAIPAHMEQLLVYAALFCLEYNIKPSDIKTELRIYQNNQIIYDNPSIEDIIPVMDKIITINKSLSLLKGR